VWHWELPRVTCIHRTAFRATQLLQVALAATQSRATVAGPSGCLSERPPTVTWLWEATRQLWGPLGRLATVRSGPDRGLFWRPLKIPDRMVQRIGTAVWTIKPQSGPVWGKLGPDHMVRSKTGLHLCFYANLGLGRNLSVRALPLSGTPDPT
jgi:hypothetical protein